MTHETPLSGLAEVATDQLAEIHRLREINAELLGALRDAREVMRLAFNDVPGWTDAYADAMGRSDAAITRAEAGK